MGRAVLVALCPWLAVLVALVLCLRLLVRLDASEFRPARLGTLHRDEAGSSQSLSFVLTLPFFIMVLMFIVQVSQVMIGTIVVNYAAFAAARSAIVWIPARLGDEWENCISLRVENREIYADGELAGWEYVIRDDPIAPVSPKYARIARAAKLACMPISPSRNVGLTLTSASLGAESFTLGDVDNSLWRAYQSIVPTAAGRPLQHARLTNKLAWSAARTRTYVRVFHPNNETQGTTEPFLRPYPEVYGRNARVIHFLPNEIGWQDLITVTVSHDLALLPGPGAVLARALRGMDMRGTPLPIARDDEHGLYYFTIRAQASLGNEGRRSVLPYEHAIE